ncbi:hypothetical protein [Lutibacter sp.]
MRQLKNVIYLVFALTVILSCEKEVITVLPENAEVNNQFTKFSKIDKELITNQIFESLNNTKAKSNDGIGYVGVLCGENITGTYVNEADYQNIHNYYFYGTEGDVISIYVPRTTIGFDSAFNLSHNSENGSVSIWKDDNIQDSFGGCYSDPYLGNYTLPYSGIYTLSIVRAANCGFPYGYEIITTGIYCDSDDDGLFDYDDPYPHSNLSEMVSIDGCYPNVENVFVVPGATMMDYIDEIIDNINAQYNGENWDELHREFSNQLAALTASWKADRLISRRQRSKIFRCVVGADIPYFNVD